MLKEEEKKKLEFAIKIKETITPYLIKTLEDMLNDESDCCAALSEIEDLIPEEFKSIKMEDKDKEIPILTQIWFVIENTFYK